jgi:hypothetical protein
MSMLAHHLLWHLGVTAGAIVVLGLFGVPFSSALPIGIMAGCAAMVFHSGTRHEAPGPRPRPRGEVDHLGGGPPR